MRHMAPHESEITQPYDSQMFNQDTQHNLNASETVPSEYHT